MSFVVAIDGPAASGKGTIARAVALHFGLTYLDTGLIYRALAKKILTESRGPKMQDIIALAQEMDINDLYEHDLRSLEIGQAASQAASIPEVRTALIEFQRKFARLPEGAILDGRDIGTVICPDADVKLYVTASVDVRAERRYIELKASNENITLDEVKASVLERDKRDSERKTAPLKIAADALLIDTTYLSIERAIKTATEFVNECYRPRVKLD